LRLDELSLRRSLIWGTFPSLPHALPEDLALWLVGQHLRHSSGLSRCIPFNAFGTDFTTGPGPRGEYLNKARGDARKAIALAPDLAQGHLALASLFESLLDFTGASQEYGRALALEPGNATLLAAYGWFAVQMGKTEAGLAAARRAVALDPLNSWNHISLGKALMFARRYPEAIAALTDARALSPNDWYANSWLGSAYYSSGDFRRAEAVFESVQPANTFNRLQGLAMAYDKLRRHADAETLFAQARASQGDNVGVFYAMIYAQWGDTARALDWLEAAMRQQDPYLENIKTAPLLDPLRKEPRFQAIERALKFPD
jgi:tetratricopeptide (TPR) repeat protein